MDTQPIIPSEDLLQLTFCPNCDYSLEGLPSIGRCPECGQDYDQSFVIIRCRGAMDRRRGSSVIGGIAMVLMMFLILRFSLGLLRQPYLLCAIGFALAMFAISLLDRFTSPRKGQWLLWIAPEGMSVQIDFDPQSLIARLRRWLPIIYQIVISCVLWIPLRPIMGWMPVVIMTVACSFFFLYLQSVAKTKLSVQPAGTRPGLIAWDQFTRIQLLRIDTQKFTLKGHRDTWVNKRKIVDVRFDADSALASQLKQRITQWSGQIVDSNLLIND